MKNNLPYLMTKPQYEPDPGHASSWYVRVGYLTPDGYKICECLFGGSTPQVAKNKALDFIADKLCLPKIETEPLPDKLAEAVGITSNVL